MTSTGSNGDILGWLGNTALTKPEAMLMLAAGVALLMRTKASGSRTGSGVRSAYGQPGSTGYRRPGSAGNNSSAEQTATLGGKAAAMGDQVSQYAGNVRDQLADTATSYGKSIADAADSARATAVTQAQWLGEQGRSAVGSGVELALQQPIVLAALGIAAGAAIGAILPATDIETNALQDVGGAVMSAAEQAKQRAMAAASDAGERLVASASEHGLSADGLKEMARDALGQGTKDNDSEATTQNSRAKGT